MLAPDAAPPLLSPGALRLEALADAGADGCLLLPFDRETAALSPADFCTRVLGPWTGAAPGRSATVVAGPNWRFGRARAGALRDVSALTGGRVGTLLVPLLERRGAPVSSSRIRDAVRAGDLEAAADLLGRPFRTRDRALAGRSRGVGTRLGAPTANLLPEGFTAIDPWAHPYVYRVYNPERGLDADYESKEDTLFVLASLGPDGEGGSGDDITVP